jgi:hypothetical protein
MMSRQNLLRSRMHAHVAFVFVRLVRAGCRATFCLRGFSMATVELTLEQLRDALLQLPESQRQQLLADITRLSAAEARAAAQRVRGTFRMPARQRKRMSELLAKGNNGTLTDQESQELDALVDQFEQKTLAMTRALTRSGTSS